jgi:hypothetical protein
MDYLGKGMLDSLATSAFAWQTRTDFNTAEEFGYHIIQLIDRSVKR